MSKFDAMVHYLRIPQNNIIAFLCKYCKVKVYTVKNITKQRIHLTKCNNVPCDVKTAANKNTKYNPKEVSSVDLTANDLDCTNGNETADIQSSASKSFSSFQDEIGDDTDLLRRHSMENEGKKKVLSEKSQSSSMFTFCDTVSHKAKEAIDEKLARFFYSASIPFAVCDNKHFKAFMKEIRPAYSPPSRHTLAGKLLDEEYKRVHNTMETELYGKCVCLQLDFWTNVKQDSILDFCIVTDERQFFVWKSMCTGSAKHTAGFVAEQCQKVINELKAYQCMVTGIVTDNASNMKSAWSILQDANDIQCYGCLSHFLDLLYSDLAKLDSFSTCFRDAKLVVRKIKGSHTCYSKLKEIQMCRNNKVLALHIPGDTRWNSIIITLDSIIRSKEELKILAITDDIPLDDHVKSLLLLDRFWRNVQHCEKLLKPIFNVIQFLQRNSTVLSDAVEIFHYLESVYETENSILPIVLQRKEAFLLPIHYAANFLDPFYKLKHCGAKFEEVITLLLQLSKYKCNSAISEATLLEAIADYKTGSNLWAKSYIKTAIENLDQIKFWKAYGSDSQLYEVAKKINFLPATTAYVERIFSKHKFVQSKNRNRLLNSKAEKLVFLACNLVNSNSTAIYRFNPTSISMSNSKSIAQEDLDKMGCTSGNLDDSDQLTAENSSDSSMESENELACSNNDVDIPSGKRMRPNFDVYRV